MGGYIEVLAGALIKPHFDGDVQNSDVSATGVPPHCRVLAQLDKIMSVLTDDILPKFAKIAPDIATKVIDECSKRFSGEILTRESIQGIISTELERCGMVEVLELLRERSPAAGKTQAAVSDHFSADRFCSLICSLYANLLGFHIPNTPIFMPQVWKSARHNSSHQVDFVCLPTTGN